MALVTARGTFIPFPLSSVSWGDKIYSLQDHGLDPFSADFETPEDAEEALAALMAKIPDLPASFALGATWSVLTPKGPVTRKVTRYQPMHIGEAVLRLWLEPLAEPLPPHPDGGTSLSVFMLTGDGDKPTPTLAVPRALPDAIAWAPLTAFESPEGAAWGPKLARALVPGLRADNPTGLRALLEAAKPADLRVRAWAGSFSGERAAVAVLTVEDADIAPDDRIACTWLASALSWVDESGALISRIDDPGAPDDMEMGCGEVLFRVTETGLPDAFVYELPVWTTTTAALYRWRGDKLERQKVYSHGFE
jgi:hypothetical protein